MSTIDKNDITPGKWDFDLLGIFSKDKIVAPSLKNNKIHGGQIKKEDGLLMAKSPEMLKALIEISNLADPKKIEELGEHYDDNVILSMINVTAKQIIKEIIKWKRQ